MAENHANISDYSRTVDELSSMPNPCTLLRARRIPVLDADYREERAGNGKAVRADRLAETFLRNNDFLGLIKLLDVLKDSLVMSSPLTSEEHAILREKLGGDEDYGLILKDGFVDMTLDHAVMEDGQLLFFDQRNIFADIPLNYILYRSVIELFARFRSSTLISPDSVLDYFGITAHRDVYDRLGEYIAEKNACHDPVIRDTWPAKPASADILEKLLAYKRNAVNPGDAAALEEIISDLERHTVDLNNTLTLYTDRLDREKAEQIDAKDREVREMREIILDKLAFTEMIMDRESKEKRRLDLLEDECREKTAELMCERDREIQELKCTLQCRDGHIEQLLEKDRELERIKNSDVWKKMCESEPAEPESENKRKNLLLALLKLPLRAIRKMLRGIRHFLGRIKRRLFAKKRAETPETPETAPVRELSASDTDAKSTDSLDQAAVKKDSASNRNIPGSPVKSLEDYRKLALPSADECLVSIVIPVYNQFDYTYNCIRSILDNSGDVPYEILIADDVSTDLTLQIRDLIKGITVITNETNQGFLKNCNHAAGFARGKYILFLNNDTLVQDNWLKPLVNLIESDPSIGLVGSKLIYAADCLQEAGGIFWKDGSAWNYGNKKDPTLPEFNYVKEADFISGAAIMIARDLWTKIGGFDEVFAPAYYEDCDLAFTVRKLGYKVMYQPLSVVIHLEGISNGTDLNSGMKSYQVTNQTKFCRKWRDALENAHFINGENVFLARDRSRGRKHILVIDHYVPHYDKDAGGKCTNMYIKLFVKLGMQVTFLGDNFYPHQPYTEELEQIGVEVIYGNYYAQHWKEWIKENGRYFDYAYLNRPHIAIKYIDVLRDYSNCKIIYFGMDLHYLRELRQYEIEGKPELLESSRSWKMKEFELFQKTDVIWVVGSYEQEIVQKQFPNKLVLNIPLYVYEKPALKKILPFEERRDIIFVGSFGHPPNRDCVLWFAKEVFPQILSEYPDIKWYIVGSNPQEDVKALASDHIIVTGFVSDQELNDLYASCRMAVVPLRVGAGVKGKVVESIYYGIPLVTTPIGAEGISQEEEAFVVTQPDRNMAKVINDLYMDFESLKAISDRSRLFIDRYYSEKTAIEVVSTALAK